MKNVLLIFLVITIGYIRQLNAQCNPPAALDCAESSVLCSLDELDGFACSNPDFENRTGPLPLCNGAGIPHNTNWWAFIADGSFMTLRIEFEEADCKGGDVCPIYGIQGGIIDDCGGNTMTCSAACNNSTFSLSFQSLPCHTYYVWIDGCCKDVCQYTIAVDGGGPPSIPRPIPVPELVGRACPCGIAEVCVAELQDCDAVKQWTIDGIDDPNFDDFECLNFELKEDGAPVEICVTFTIGNPANPLAICDQETSCFTLIPEPVEQIFEPPVFVCWEDHEGSGYEWHDSIVYSSCINPPCRIRVPGPSDCCVDYEAEINMLEERQLVEVYKFFCGTEDLPLLTEDGSVWREETCGSEIMWTDLDYHNCDTTYLLYLTIFDPEVELTQECESCSGAVTLRATVDNYFDCIGGDVSWVSYWLNDKFDTIGVGEDFVTQDTGLIYYNMHVIYVDITTGEVQQCDLSGLPPWSIYVKDPALADPDIIGTSPICKGVLGEYVLNNSYGDICEYQWYVKRGGGQIITPSYVDSTHITVDWTNITGNEGEVCVSVLSDCAKSKEECFIVEVKEAPTPDAGPDTVLCARQYKMDGTIDVAGGSWIVVKSPGNVTMDKDNIDTDVSVDQYGEYVFVWKETILTCSGEDTITILFNSDPTFGPVDTICLTDAINYRLEFEVINGTGPYTIVEGGGIIDANNNYSSDTIIDDVSHRIVIKDVYGCFFEFEINYNCVCPNDIGIVSNDTLKSCGISSVTIDYNPTNMILGPKDTFQYVLYTTLGDIFGSQIDRNHTGTFIFNPNTMNFNQVYFLGVVVGEDEGNGFVNTSAGCVQVAEGQPAIWYEIPTPDAGNDFEICSRRTMLSSTRSMQGTEIKWLNTAGAVIDNPDSETTNITVTDFGTYVFKFVEINNICSGMDSIVITFNESPDLNALKKICIDQNLTYEWTYVINIGKGTPPYRIISGNGNLDVNTGTFTSNRIASLANDLLIVEDVNGCRDSIDIIHNCDCGLTKPGTMDTDVEEKCQDQCITVVTNNDHGAENDDCIFMILHSDSASIDSLKVIDIQNFNPNGNTFCFDQGRMTLNEIYYISYVVGQCNGNTLQYSDACLKIISKPVIFNPYPAANAGNDKDICGLFTQLDALPSIGSGQWSILTTPLNANALLDMTLPASNLTVDQYGTYTFVWTENNKGCETADTVQITFHGAPIWSNVQFECDSVAENYRMTFEVNGGDQLSWDMQDASGWRPIKIVGNGYRTPWVSWNKAISLNITDRFDCLPALLDTSYVCDCITDGGSVEMDPNIFCVNDLANASYSGGVEDPNDIIVYYLHDGDAINIGNQIFDKNSTGIFRFDPSKMTLNTVYYVAVRVGNDDGFGGVKSNDHCAIQSQGIPVAWYDDPDPIIVESAKTLTCLISSIILDGSSSVNRSGTGNLTFVWSTVDGKFEANSNLNDIRITIIAPGTYKLIVINDYTGCMDEVTVIIDSDRELINADAGLPKVLTCDVTSVELDGTGSDQGQNFSVSWTGPGIDNTNRNEIKPKVVMPGIYNIRITNNISGCDEIDSVRVSSDYTTPEPDIVQNGLLICAIVEAELDGSASTSLNGIRSYEWKSSNGSILGANNQPKVKIGSPGTYTLIVIDDGTGCADTLSMEVQEELNTLSFLDLGIKNLACAGEGNGSINVLNTMGGNGPYQYAINSGPFSNANEFRNLGAGTYTVQVKDINGCELDTVVSIVQPDPVGIKAKEDRFVEYGDNILLDTLWYDLIGTSAADPDTDIYWEDEDGNRVDPQLDDLKKSRYTFTVVVRDGNGCEARDVLNIFVKINRDIYIPNVFAPINGNALGVNKVFRVFGKPGIVDRISTFQVYSRWGELMYQNSGDIEFDANGTSNDGWDGRFNNVEVNPGVYVYYIEVQFIDLGEGVVSKKYYGDVTVLR